MDSAAEVSHNQIQFCYQIKSHSQLVQISDQLSYFTPMTSLLLWKIELTLCDHIRQVTSRGSEMTCWDHIILPLI